MYPLCSMAHSCFDPAMLAIGLLDDREVTVIFTGQSRQTAHHFGKAKT
jgi:hypothetical protein